MRELLRLDPTIIAIAAGSPTSLVLPEPPSANRWWRMVVIKGDARMLLSSEARKYKASIAQIGSGRIIAEGPVKVSVDWYRGRRSGDLDKRLGVLFDALQGVLYTTDAQVVEIVARRHDDPGNARVVVSVTRVHAVQEALSFTDQE